MLVIEWFCTGMKVTHVLLRILYIHYTGANVTIPVEAYFHQLWVT